MSARISRSRRESDANRSCSDELDRWPTNSRTASLNRTQAGSSSCRMWFFESSSMKLGIGYEGRDEPSFRERRDVVFASVHDKRRHAHAFEEIPDVHAGAQALQQRAVTGKLAILFGERLEQLASIKTQSDLRVTISWNTDATDVDLWVIEPDNTKCYYPNRVTKNGGELTEDMTQGYGPERFQAKPRAAHSHEPQWADMHPRVCDVIWRTSWRGGDRRSNLARPARDPPRQ